MIRHRSIRIAQSIVEYAILVAMVAGLVAIGAVQLTNQIASTINESLSGFSFTAGPAPTPTPSPPSGSVVLANWVMDPATCAGWNNATWKGSGCGAASAPKIMTSPEITLDDGVTGVSIAVEGDPSNGPTNLVVKVTIVTNSGTTTVNLGTLAAGKGSVSGSIDLDVGSKRLYITLQGPGVVKQAKVLLNSEEGYG
jgi:hypothetical protein